MFLSLVLKFSQFLVVWVAFLAIAAWTGAPLAAAAEHFAGRPLSYEVVVRLYLLWTLLLVCGTYVAFGMVRSRPLLSRRTAVAACAVFAALIFVSAFDTTWSITEEASWIKYPTALALILTGALFWFGAMRVHERFTRIIFLVLGAGSIFAALDELFMIHERIGAGGNGDAVTFIYGIIGVGVLAFVWRSVRHLIARPHWQRGLWIIFFGMLLFVLATIFDTFDFAAHALVRRAALWWLEHNYEFGHAWEMIWSPKFFLNAWEEFFEFIASAFFAYGAAVIVAGEFRSRVVNAAAAHRAYPRCSVALVSTMTTLCLMLVATTIVTQPPGLLANNAYAATRIADERDGLFHTDDLDFHPLHGVAVANESAAWQHKTPRASGAFLIDVRDAIQRVPDSTQLLRDADSVAFTTSTLYVSDSSQGRIFARDMKSGEWRTVPVGENFPRHPEGLSVSASGIITVLDESARSISHITPSGRVTVEKPTHKKFVAPEGIVWHPQLKKFVITDDVSGTIFLYEPNKPLMVCADNSSGLRAPEDVAVTPSGNIIVSDNGSRSIFIFDTACHKIRTLQFNPLYRDVQGVAVNAAGDIYIVTANGFDNKSFMPSMVWKIVNP